MWWDLDTARDSHGTSYLLINGLSSAQVVMMMVVMVDTLAASCQPRLRLHGNTRSVRWAAARKGKCQIHQNKKSSLFLSE